MSLWTSLEPASTTVDPGGSTTVRLRLRNTGDVVDEYRCVPVGDLAPWTTVEPGTLRLYPGTTGTVELTFAPPRTPDAAAGPHPYGVQIIPTEFPEATTVPEGNVTVTPFSEVRAELVPANVTGRFRGRPRLAIDNLGNVKLTASVTGHDNSDQLSYEINPANVQIEPGRAAFLKTTLKPRQIIWAGAKQSRPYTLSVQRSGAEPLPVRGTYVQPGLLPRWLGVLFSLLLGLAIAFLMIWLTYKPDVATKATDKTPDQTAHTIQPSAPAQPTPQQPTEEPKKNPGGGGGGDGTPQKVPPVETPSGRNTPEGQSHTSLPTHAAKCEVRSKVLYCTDNKPGIKLYRQRNYSSDVVYTFPAGTSSRYSCWGHGRSHSGGNDIWYWTHFEDEDYWGNVPAVDVSTNHDPAPGLPQC